MPTGRPDDRLGSLRSKQPPPTNMNKMVRILTRMKQYELLQLFTVYLRYLLGCAFMVAAFSMGKVNQLSDLGPNMMTSLDNPIGLAFASFIHSPLYWGFIGWSQITAGALLVTQRFARAGVLIYLVIILNIFIITQSYGFAGTNVITGLMLLAALYLAVWEGDVLQYLFIRPSEGNLPAPRPAVERLGLWSITGVVMVLTLLGLGLTPYRTNPILGCSLTLLEGMVALAIYLVRFRSSRVRAAVG
jgi:uncharacterized membrane protein YphA (DoxX/SURF4 family)